MKISGVRLPKAKKRRIFFSETLADQIINLPPVFK
jgi:hypothetical protein